MSDIKINVKGGIIIIGSLIWQDDLSGDDKKRKKWRDESLNIQNKILVKLPIRYGRYSRNGIYTMVFSINSEKRKTLGTGYIVSLKKNPFKDINSIINEAVKMSEAEGMNKKFAAGNQDKWGSMAIIFNNSKISKNDKNKILIEWQNRYIDDGGGKDCNDYGFGLEKRSISKKGVLQIKWPKALASKNIENLNGFDFLIASITKPKHKDNQKKYPSISEIAETVKEDSSRKYFVNNYSNGIITFQDIRIINIIQSAL